MGEFFQGIVAGSPVQWRNPNAPPGGVSGTTTLPNPGVIGSQYVIPDQISGLTGWLDCSDYVYAATSTWASRVGGWNVTQLIAFAPTVGGALNGRNTIVYNGAGQNLGTGPALSTVITAAAYTYFALINVAGISSNSANVYLNNASWDSTVSYAGEFLRNTPDRVGAYNWDGAENPACYVNISLSTWTLVTQEHGGGNLTVGIGGAAPTSVASGNTQVLIGSLQLGVSGGGASPFNGQDACRIWYNVVLSATDERSIRNYMRAQFGQGIGL